MANPSGLRRYSAKERNVYLTGMFGQNIIYNVAVTIMANYYLQNVLYIPVLAVAAIVAIAQVWDAFNDPMMGTLIDRTRTKWGKCRPYLIFSPVVIAIFTMLCFTNGTYDTQVAGVSVRNILIVAWAGVAYVLWGMSYTVGDISLWSLTSLLTEEEKQRQKLQAAARIAAALGTGLAALSIQPLSFKVKDILLNRRAEAHGIANYAEIVEQSKKALVSINDVMAEIGFDDYASWSYTYEKRGFIIVAAVFTLIGFVTFQLVGLFTKEKISPSKKANNIKQNFKLMWNNKPFRQLLISGILSGPTGIMMLVAMTLVAKYYAMKNPGDAAIYTIILGGGLFAGMLVSTGLVPPLLKRFSKRGLYIFSNLLVVLPSVGIFALYWYVHNHTEYNMTRPLYVGILALLLMFCGIRLGISSALQTMMISDCVDYEDYKSGLRPDGVFFSGQTFIVKIGSGLSAIIYGLMCLNAGYTGNNIKLLDNFMADGGVPRDAMSLGDAPLQLKGETIDILVKLTDGSSITHVLQGNLAQYTLSGNDVKGFFTMMFLALSIPPAIGALLATLPMIKYALDNKTYANVLETLQQRRREKGELTEETDD
ncbi:MAG: MFS transporter [Oscillospiraceae bacterium]|nr:MFS transporter [Oscillospiraceae bacterium]